MKHFEEHPLLNELLTGPEVAEFREASLNQALTTLRHTRRRRKVLRIAAWAVLPALLVFVVLLGRSVNLPGRVPAVVEPTVATTAPQGGNPSSVEFISDEDLLSLFPNQPLALVGPEGNQQLVFLDQSAPN